MPDQNRRQRRGDATRRRLIESTKALLNKHDLQSVTLDQIAEAVGVAKSSILWHFGSREGLVTEAIYSLFEEIETRIQLQKVDLPTLDERLDYFLTTVGSYFDENPDAKGTVLSLIFNQQVPEAIHDRIRQQWQQHIAQIAAFLAGDDFPYDADVAAGLMALLHGTYVQWYLKGRSDDVGERLKRYFQALRGV